MNNIWYDLYHCWYISDNNNLEIECFKEDTNKLENSKFKYYKIIAVPKKLDIEGKKKYIIDFMTPDIKMFDNEISYK